MLIPPAAHDVLLSAGATVTADAEPDRRVKLVITVPDPDSSQQTRLRLDVHRVGGSLSPKTLQRAVSEWRKDTTEGNHGVGLLVIARTASAETLDLAGRQGVSLIVLNPDRVTGPSGHLVLAPGHIVPLGADPVEVPQRRATRGVPPWGASSIIRTLLLLGGRSQTEIAQLSGTSQPRVSHVLRDLAGESLVRPPQDSSSRAWTVPDRSRLLDRWLATYPGPGGVATYWYGLESLREQALAASGTLTPDGAALVSGDVAADLIAPWARPSRVTIYSRRGSDLSAAGLVPATADGATLILTVPQDTGLWLTAEPYWRGRTGGSARSGLRLADPLQVLYDVLQSSSPDAEQAARALREHIVDA